MVLLVFYFILNVSVELLVMSQPCPANAILSTCGWIPGSYFFACGLYVCLRVEFFYFLINGAKLYFFPTLDYPQNIMYKGYHLPTKKKKKSCQEVSSDYSSSFLLLLWSFWINHLQFPRQNNNEAATSTVLQSPRRKKPWLCPSPKKWAVQTGVTLHCLFPVWGKRCTLSTVLPQPWHS